MSCLVSFLLFRCASVGDYTLARVPHFLTILNGTYLFDSGKEVEKSFGALRISAVELKSEITLVV